MNHLVIEIRKEREASDSDCDDCPERVTIGTASVDLSGSYKNLVGETIKNGIEELNSLTKFISSEKLDGIEDVIDSDESGANATTINDFSEDRSGPEWFDDDQDGPKKL